MSAATIIDTEIHIELDRATLIGDLVIPEHAHGVVAFAHGSGSGRQSPRNRFVAGRLQESGLATLLVDLLTLQEEDVDRYSGHLRFNIGLLSDRMTGVSDWLCHDERTSSLPIGCFGASTGAGAALVAAARRKGSIHAVVSRGGRPDLANEALPAVRASTLLIVGGDDRTVLRLNRDALKQVGATIKELAVVPGATHLFEEPGKLEEVAQLAAHWFSKHLEGHCNSPEGV